MMPGNMLAHMLTQLLECVGGHLDVCFRSHGHLYMCVWACEA